MEDVILYNQLTETPVQGTKLPTDYKPAMMDESPPKNISDLDKGFNPADIQTWTKYGLYTPSDVLKGVQSQEINFKNYDKNLGQLIKKLGVAKTHFRRKNK